MKQSRLYTAAAFIALSVTPAAAQNAAKAGMLSCNMSASVGLIVGSHQRIQCRFTPDAGAPTELYAGSITRVGLDVGIRAGGAMAWAVFAPTSGLHHGALRGHYVGVNGDASLGLGAGGKLLIGGSHRTISLQPLSVSGQMGVNLAIGVAGLTLR